jgi:hypothetical protein
VLFGDIPVNPGGQRVVRVVGVVVERLVRVGESVLRGFGDEVVSGAEVLVEAAMGEAGRLHDLGDAGAVEAFFADPR